MCLCEYRYSEQMQIDDQTVRLTSERRTEHECHRCPLTSIVIYSQSQSRAVYEDQHCSYVCFILSFQEDTRRNRMKTLIISASVFKKSNLVYIFRTSSCFPLTYSGFCCEKSSPLQMIFFFFFFFFETLHHRHTPPSTVPVLTWMMVTFLLFYIISGSQYMFLYFCLLCVQFPW